MKSNIYMTAGGRVQNDEIEADNAYLALLIQSVPGIVVIVKKESCSILLTNKQFEIFVGHTNWEIIENKINFIDLLGDGQQLRFMDHFNDSINNDEIRSRYIICSLIGKNGIQNSYYVYVSPVYKDNKVYKDCVLIMMHPNVSKFGIPFWSLESRDIYLEQLCDQDFGMFEWVFDTNTVYLSESVNLIFETGKSSVEAVPGFIESFIHADDKDKFNISLEIAIESGTGIDTEAKIVTGKGNVKIIQIIGRTFKDNSGKTTKFVGSARDITKQRLIEQSYRIKVEELYNSNKELEEFAYVASHDLQEPLRKISTFSDRLAAKHKNLLVGDGMMYLDRIITSAENMRILINDLLEFSRISKTKQPFAIVDINAIIRMVKVDLELMIEETHTIIECQKLPLLEGVSSQMIQLFTNIIVNAIKFRKKGVAPIIKIESAIAGNHEKSVRGLMQDRTYFRIEVIDNGIGFDETYSSRIFQVFQRLNGKSEYPGSGIGLAICKKIMEYHHGVIYAESSPGNGANFVMLIPESQQFLIKSDA